MLVLKSIEMVNICQFDHQLIPFDTGLSAVCGRNGSGKSTLLRALAYGLTGMVDGSWGTQKDLQKDGAGIPGYVEVTLDDMANGSQITIRRYAIGGAKCPDKIVHVSEDGTYNNEVLRRSNVDAYLANLYGIPCRLLFQLFWLRQSNIDMLLTSTSADVNSFLQEVFDMRNLEVVRDKIKKALDTVATGFGGTQQEISELDAELSTMPSEEYIAEGLKEAEEQLADSDKERADFLAKYGDLTDMDKVAKKVASMRSDVHQQQKMLSDADHVLSSFQEPPDLPETHSTRQEMADGISRADEKIRKAHLEQVRLENLIKNSKLNKERTEEALEAAKEKLRCPDKCELCGGEIHDQQAYMRSQCLMLTGCESLDEYQTKQEGTILAQEEAIDRNEKELHELSENVALLDKSKHLLESELQRLDDYILYKDKLAVKKASEAALAQIQPELAKMDKLLEHSDEIRALRSKLNGKNKELHAVVDKLKAEAARLQERRRNLTENIEKLQKRLEKEKVNREARGVLTELRDGLSANRVQARYLMSKIKEINRQLEHFMQFTGMPFSLYLKDDTHTFAFSNPDGFEHPTAHLSGAQKNMSAVALQMALFNVIHPNINLFLIDEPSEALDDGNKVVMAEMFRRMNNMLSAMNGTMLIVSRDEKMVESCETVITVGAS